MTQTVGSIFAAKNDRERLACRLESKILAHRRLLEGVQEQVEQSIRLQVETNSHLQTHSVILESLEHDADQTKSQLQEQQVLIEDVQAMLSKTREETPSILDAATNTLTIATSGVMNLRLIDQQHSKMFELCTKFTTEMRAAMTELTRMFFGLQAILRRLELTLPMRIGLPILQFTDALGETMALPYQLCQQWSTFKELLGVIFINKPGQARVEIGQYMIMNAGGGRLLKEAS